MSSWPAAHPHIGSLLQAQRRRLRGNFEEAIKLLRPLHDADSADVHISLELQRVYVEQGYLQKGLACGNGVAQAELLAMKVQMEEATVKLEAGDMTAAISIGREIRLARPIARALLSLISSYLRCFVHGKWEVALSEAAEVFGKYLVDWDPGEENPSLMVRIMLGAFVNYSDIPGVPGTLLSQDRSRHL